MSFNTLPHDLSTVWNPPRPIQEPIISLLVLMLSVCVDFFHIFFPSFSSFAIFIKRIFKIIINSIYVNLFFVFRFLQVLWINRSLYTKAWVSHAIWVLGGREEEEGGGERSWKERRGPLTLTSGHWRATQNEVRKKERWVEVWEVKACWCKWRETERWDRRSINK